MKKYCCFALVCVLLLGLLTGCGQTVPSTEKTKVNVYTIAGPTGVGMASLWEKQEAGQTANDYALTLVADAGEIPAALLSGSADIATIPTNAAATVANKKADSIQVLAVNTLGVLYVVTGEGETVSSVRDLEGKEIAYFGQGANPEYVLRYVLEQNKVNASLVPMASLDELVTRVATGEVKIAMLPEPKVTAVTVQMTANGKTPVTVALDMTAEWDKVAGEKSALLMGCVVARKEFVEAHPTAVETFLQEYQSSVLQAGEDTEHIATLCETYKIIPKKAIALQAIPRCNLVFLRGKEMEEKLMGYWQVLYDYDPASVGGAVPGKGLFYE